MENGPLGIEKNEKRWLRMKSHARVEAGCNSENRFATEAVGGLSMSLVGYERVLNIANSR